jgi:hypothetical protein
MTLLTLLAVGNVKSRVLGLLQKANLSAQPVFKFSKITTGLELHHEHKTLFVFVNRSARSLCWHWPCPNGRACSSSI